MCRKEAEKVVKNPCGPKVGLCSFHPLGTANMQDALYPSLIGHIDPERDLVKQLSRICNGDTWENESFDWDIALAIPELDYN